MTPLTIVYAVEQWCQQGHPLPKARDLCPAQHLPHWTTVYKTGFSSMSSLLQALSSLHEQESAGLAWLWKQEHRICLQCGTETKAPRDLCRRCAGTSDETHRPALTVLVPIGLQQRSMLYKRLTFAAQGQGKEQKDHG